MSSDLKNVTSMMKTDASGALPEGLLVAWYGDDFTGAAAVMEVLEFAGLPSLLFLEPPTSSQLALFPDLRGIGIASTARAQTPGWMAAELPGIFTCLAELKPEILHYKTCSTLDSSPETGSIGKAIEIGAEAIRSDVVPVLTAAPQMNRFQVFGHLFAGLGNQVYRLDRHPVMSRHPTTPMSESDVARHIAQQSSRIETQALTMDRFVQGHRLVPPAFHDEDKTSVLTLDCWDARSEAAAGRFIWEHRGSSRFAAGSQGVEFALVRHWQDTGQLPPVPPAAGIGHAERMISVSGSVSPTTADQIAWSRQNGFACIPFDARAACGDAAALALEENRVVQSGLDALSQGRDPLIHTAEGPDDPAVPALLSAVEAAGADLAQTSQRAGEALGRVLRRLLAETNAPRAVVSGGDTSGYATRQLGIFALSALAPTIPGASIFKAHAEGPMDGLELALKGGQMGSPDYFGWVRDGGGIR